MALIPIESASISSVTFPVPKNRGVVVYFLLNSEYLLIDSTSPCPAGSRTGSAMIFSIPALRADSIFQNKLSISSTWSGITTATAECLIILSFTSLILPEFRLSTISTPFSSAVLMRVGSSVSMLSGSPVADRAVFTAFATSSFEVSSDMPRSIISAPVCSKYNILSMSSCFSRWAASTISAITFIREFPPIFVDFITIGAVDSFSSMVTFPMAFVRIFPASNSHAGTLLEKVTLSAKDNAKPRSTACFGPRRMDVPSSFSRSVKFPDARPGISMSSYFRFGMCLLRSAGVIKAATSISRTRTSALSFTAFLTAFSAR